MARAALWIMILMPMVAVSTAATCPSAYNLIGESCYFLSSVERSWYSGEEFCKKLGARLATVTNKQQYDGLLNLITKSDPGVYWLSGNNFKGEWLWNNGKKMNRNWWGRYTTANNRCAYFCSYTLKYWPSTCNRHKKIICETDIEIEEEVGNEVETDSLRLQVMPNVMMGRD